MVSVLPSLETMLPPSDLDYVLSKAIAHNRYAKSGSGGVLLSKNGRFSFVSGEFLTLIESSLSEIVGKNISDFIGIESAQQYFFNDVDKLFQGSTRCLSMVLPWKISDHKEILLSLEIYPPLEGHQELACYAKKFIPENRVQKKLSQNIYLERILQNINAVIWLRTADARRYLYMSPNCEKVFGMTLDAYHEDLHNFLRRVHPDDQKRFIQEYFSSDKESSYRYQMPDNTWKHFTAYRFFIENQDGVPTMTTGITIDNTNLYNAQQEIMRQKTKLQQKNSALKSANKMLEDFTALACHDLSQPLRVFASYVNILHKDYFQHIDEGGQKLFEAMFKATQRMKSLIQSMADVYLTQHAEKNCKYINPGAVLEEVLELVSLGQANRDLTIEKGRLYPLKVAESHLTALFKNLIENAVKYNNNSPHIKIWSKKLRSGIVYAIKDNGMGIPHKEQQQIFSVGYRLPNAEDQEGTGIGLSACKKIVWLYRGKIWVHSTAGQGTTFYLFFPNETKA